MRTQFFWMVFLCTLNLNAQVEITGTVRHFNDSLFYISETGGFDIYTKAWRDHRVKVIVSGNNTFKITIPERSTGRWYFASADKTQIFDLTKGKNQTLIIDFAQPIPVYAIGLNAGDFNFSAYLNDSIKKYISGNNFYERIKNNSIDSILIYRNSLALYKINVLETYRSKHHLSDPYYKWLHTQFVYEPYERTISENLMDRDSLDDRTISLLVEKGLNDDYAALNTSEYNELIDFYIDMRLKKKSKKISFINRFNFVMDSAILTGHTKEIYLTRCMASFAKSPDTVYQSLYNMYDRVVHIPALKYTVIRLRDEYNNHKTLSRIAANSEGINSLTELFRKYNGQVIYVDFWASWCIPCRAEMPNAAVLQGKLTGKNIVFLYLGYNDKEKDWKKARQQILVQGEHYLLSEKMIKEADELFTITGIPHYAIIGKDGNVINKNAGRPNDAYLELLGLLSK